jgi:hypothetical protein
MSRGVIPGIDKRIDVNLGTEKLEHILLSFQTDSFIVTIFSSTGRILQGIHAD